MVGSSAFGGQPSRARGKPMSIRGPPEAACNPSQQQPECEQRERRSEGEYGPQALTKVWDHDLRIGSETAAKRLLINGSTPFSFTTGDNEVDEETVAGNPNWPCCPPQDKDGVTYTVHLVEFRNEPPGRRIVGERIFTESESRLAFLRPAIVRPAQSGTLTPPNAVVAFLVTATPGPFLRVEFDEPQGHSNEDDAHGQQRDGGDLPPFEAHRPAEGLERDAQEENEEDHDDDLRHHLRHNLGVARLLVAEGLAVVVVVGNPPLLADLAGEHVPGRLTLTNEDG